MNVDQLVTLIRALPESKLNEVFVDEKYGTYYRNQQGLVEHMYDHPGQIVLIKKMLP